jgi:hypothetical protein
MSRTPFKPISYITAQVGFMVKAAMFLNPSFTVSGLSAAQLRLTACGRMKPRAAVLAKLNLTETSGGRYAWTPR